MRLLQIAQVLKSNGTDGELVMGFRNVAPEDITVKEPVFIEFDGLPVPFFIESLAKRGNTKALVHLTDIESFEDSEELVGKAVYIDEEKLGEKEYEEGDFSFLAGWTLLNYSPAEDADESEGLDEEYIEEVGEILDFIDIPSNPCIEVETKNGAAMIPLHEDLILSVDPENRELIMQIPEGLL